MREILVNLLLVLLWLVLTAALARGIAWLDEVVLLRDWQAFGLWMVGQAVILLPLLSFLWRHRRYAWER